MLEKGRRRFDGSLSSTFGLDTVKAPRSCGTKTRMRGRFEFLHWNISSPSGARHLKFGLGGGGGWTTSISTPETKSRHLYRDLRYEIAGIIILSSSPWIFPRHGWPQDQHTVLTIKWILVSSTCIFSRVRTMFEKVTIEETITRISISTFLHLQSSGREESWCYRLWSRAS